jgi:hypothetical protein
VLWAKYKAELAAKHLAVGEPIATQTFRATASFDLVPMDFQNGDAAPPFGRIYRNDFVISSGDRTVAVVRNLSRGERGFGADVTRYCIYNFKELYHGTVRLTELPVGRRDSGNSAAAA